MEGWFSSYILKLLSTIPSWKLTTFQWTTENVSRASVDTRMKSKLAKCNFFWRTTSFKACSLAFTSSAYVCFRHWCQLYFLLVMTSWLTPIEVMMVEVEKSQICSRLPRHSLFKIWSQGLSAGQDRSNAVHLFAVCFPTPSRLLYFTRSAFKIYDCSHSQIVQTKKNMKSANLSWPNT